MLMVYGKKRPFVLSLVLLLLAACGQPAATQVPAQLPTAVVALSTPRAQPPAAASATSQPSTPTTAPSPTVAQSWRFVVLGDIRTEGLNPPDVTYQIVEQATTAQPAIVLTVGDMINALSTPDEVRQQWQNLRAAVAPLGQAATGAPWLLPTPGNHDVQSGDWATGLLTDAFPELPINGPPGFERRAYSVDYGGVRFVSLDSEQRAQMHLLDDAQLAWLEVQLRDNPGHAAIVFSHDPAYPVGPHIGSSLDVYPQARDRLWALLRQYGAVYIAGHEHLYNHQVIDGAHQIIAGTSGSFVYGGFGGEFYHYVVGEVGAGGITFVVYDQNGLERDRFTVP